VAVPNSSRSGWGRSGHRRAVITGAIVLVILLGGGAAAWAASNSGSSGYRLATVTRADIGTSLTVVGTVEPVNDASAAFQVAGQVATVTAAVGQQVTAGESLATLDTTSLSESVSSAQSTLNSGEAKLTQDETSESTSTSSTGSTSSSSTTTTTTTPSKSGTSTASQSTITQDQNTLTQDEAKTNTDQQKEAADLTQAQQACGTGSTTPTTSTTTSTTNPSNCQAALAQVSKDQQQVSADQAAVSKDEAALSQALSQGSSGTTSTSTGTGSGTGTGTGTSTGTGSGSGSPTQTTKPASSTSGTGTTGTGTGTTGASGPSGGTGTSQSSDTPQQIASDQAAIDTAQAELTVAEQSLNEANLTSPIDGTIVSVGITAGDSVSANSSTDVIVIIGTQSFEVTGTLSSTQVASVKVGDAAGVQVDGTDGTIDGTVSQVGPVQSDASGYTYPVVVALPSSATGLFTGSTANVVIATGAVSDVVAVPTSAVQSLASRSYVEMLSNGTLTRKLIKVGMVGDTYTQVLSGLTPGQSVVLADYAEPVPSSNTSTLGGFGGGGFGGGGFGGGGAFRITRTATGGAFGGG
jgi:HlyD family secretion protein